MFEVMLIGLLVLVLVLIPLCIGFVAIEGSELQPHCHLGCSRRYLFGFIISCSSISIPIEKIDKILTANLQT